TSSPVGGNGSVYVASGPNAPICSANSGPLSPALFSDNTTALARAILEANPLADALERPMPAFSDDFKRGVSYPLTEENIKRLIQLQPELTPYLNTFIQTLKTPSLPPTGTAASPEYSFTFQKAESFVTPEGIPISTGELNFFRTAGEGKIPSVPLKG